VTRRSFRQRFFRDTFSVLVVIGVAFLDAAAAFELVRDGSSLSIGKGLALPGSGPPSGTDQSQEEVSCLREGLRAALRGGTIQRRGVMSQARMSTGLGRPTPRTQFFLPPRCTALVMHMLAWTHPVQAAPHHHLPQAMNG
jgi:hypothetical protein